MQSMDTSGFTNTKTYGSCASSSPSLSSPSSSPVSHNPAPSSPPPPTIVMSPCAACKILRRRCANKCILAPYFPPTEPAKFTIAHRVFGASNIIKFLQDLPESQRADAVTSMVYEASARIRDPVYGCAGAICQLQNQIDELQAQLAKTRAELVNMQCQQANLMALLCMEMSQSSHQPSQDHQSSIDNLSHLPQNNSPTNMGGLLDDNYLSPITWEPLWT